VRPVTFLSVIYMKLAHNSRFWKMQTGNPMWKH
jgi:hypothetical protein